MNRLNLRLVTTTTAVFAGVAYLACVVLHLLLPNTATSTIFLATFPGFSWTPGGVVLGLVEVMLYAGLGSVVYVELYNFFAARFSQARI